MQIFVNSFDIFDTLIGRICGSPDGVFSAVADITGNQEYPKLRKLAEHRSNGKWDNIWENFAVISKLSSSQVDDIKNLEWSIEKEYSFPIVMNSMLLQPNDILVSDMYLCEKMISDLLNNNNIINYNRIYVTPNGKRSGSIWKTIRNDGYIINQHMGDNYDCDINSPKQNGIKTCFFDKDYNDAEKYLLLKRYHKLANLCRITRYSNPYPTHQSNECIIWHKLSSILPVCRILFSGINKKYYIDSASNFYSNYDNNFNSYYTFDIKNIICSIDNIIDKYVLKLKINIDDYIYDHNLIHYLKTYCEIEAYDIL